MMQLHVNGDQTQVIRLRKNTYLVGRSNICNLRFTDPELELVHARLKVEPHALSVISQDRAEIRVNGARVTGETTLEHGDELVLGATKMKVVDARQQAPSRQDDRAQPSPLRHTVSGSATGHSVSDWILQGLSPGLTNHRYAINGTAIMGRARECDIHIGEAHMSRQHVRLSIGEDGLVVEDLNSANGTYVNGRRVNAAVLQNGDELSLDSVKFRIIHTSTAAGTEETLVKSFDSENIQPKTEPSAAAPSIAAPSIAAPSTAESSTAAPSTGEPSTAAPSQTTRPEPPKVTGPTAIDIQRAALSQLGDKHPGRQALAGGHANHSTFATGWLALAAMTVVLVGALWGATSFLDAPFRG